MAARPSYQTEPIELREPIWEAGHIEPLQMMRIAAWKSARGLAPLTMNFAHEIRSRTASALDAIEPWRHVNVIREPLDADAWTAWQVAVATAIGSKNDGTGLLGLDGFGYPMASAFLAILAPTGFPVIDRWTVQAVYGSTPGNYQRSQVYAHFTQTLVQYAPQYPTAASIHEVDQEVMNAAMRCRHEQPCDCLPFSPVTMPTALAPHRSTPLQHPHVRM